MVAGLAARARVRQATEVQHPRGLAGMSPELGLRGQQFRIQTQALRRGRIGQHARVQLTGEGRGAAVTIEPKPPVLAGQFPGFEFSMPPAASSRSRTRPVSRTLVPNLALWTLRTARSEIGPATLNFLRYQNAWRLPLLAPHL